MILGHYTSWGAWERKENWRQMSPNFLAWVRGFPERTEFVFGLGDSPEHT